MTHTAPLQYLATHHTLIRESEREKPHATEPIELYFWPTPNGKKITILLKEAELPYNLAPVDITAGEQFDEEFLTRSLPKQQDARHHSRSRRP